MKRLKTMANDLLELAANMEEWDKYINKIKKPEEDEKLQTIINDRNELISKLLSLDLETRFQYSERPMKAQNKWFKENWGLSESTLDFYRNKKNISIDKQYNELKDKLNEAVIKEDDENTNIESTNIEGTNLENTNLENTNITDSNILKKEKSDIQIEADVILEDENVPNRYKHINKRSTEECIWDKVSFSNLALLEPSYHNPYKYGDILEDGNVFVWKGKVTDKNTFLKSYTKSKQFLDKKKKLKISIGDIIKKTGLPRNVVQNSMYYPYIKINEIMVEQFERKFKKI